MEDENLPPFLVEKLAIPLVPLSEKIKTPQELIEFLTLDTAGTRCAICHSDSCMMCRLPKYACGCFCPQCGRFMHLHCASGWAESQKDMPPSLLKCPVCSIIIKLPSSKVPNSIGEMVRKKRL